MNITEGPKVDLGIQPQQTRKESLIEKTFGLGLDSNMRASKQEDQLLGVDSDYLTVYTKNSLLPIKTAGTGVFAKTRIEKDTIICEYRGSVVLSDDIFKVEDSAFDRAYNIVGPDGLHYQILGTGLCAFINDCSAAMARTISFEEWRSIGANGVSPNIGIACYEGFSYNAVALSHPNGKMFIVGMFTI